MVAVAVGGALGAPARYGVAQLIHVAPDSFPWATFGINLSGSFALGLLLRLIIWRSGGWQGRWRGLRPFAASGVLGAFTTYSTFVVEADLLVKNGHIALSLAYVAASVVGGPLAAWAGLWAGRTAGRDPAVAP